MVEQKFLLENSAKLVLINLGNLHILLHMISTWVCLTCVMKISGLVHMGSLDFGNLLDFFFVTSSVGFESFGCFLKSDNFDFFRSFATFPFETSSSEMEIMFSPFLASSIVLVENKLVALVYLHMHNMLNLA